MEFEGLPDGWEVWSTQQTKVVLTYRPDVFDSHDFPAPCLPTIFVTKGKRGRRPGRNSPEPEDPWYVTLFLEPEVSGAERTYDSRETAREGALNLAGEFATGEIAFREFYQVPREAYLDRLDELTGRDALSTDE